MTDTDREAFEAHYDAKYTPGYAYPAMHRVHAWEDWQAARAHYAPSVTEKEALASVSHISAAIGYVSSIEPGTVITEAFVERWNTYYLPKLESALRAAGVRWKREERDA